MHANEGIIAIVDGRDSDIRVETIPMEKTAIQTLLWEGLGGERTYRCTKAFINDWSFGRPLRYEYDVWHTTTVMPEDIVTASHKGEPIFHGRLIITHVKDGAIRTLSDGDIRRIKENLVPRISEDRSSLTFPLGLSL